jgi:hypothetical protein
MARAIRGLAGSGKPSDGDYRRLFQTRRVTDRKVEIVSGSRRRRATLFFAELRFVQSEAQYLAAHVSAIAAVKRQQHKKISVAGSPLIGFGKEVVEIRSAARVQVHRQKRRLARYVAALHTKSTANIRMRSINLYNKIKAAFARNNIDWDA